MDGETSGRLRPRDVQRKVLWLVVALLLLVLTCWFLFACARPSMLIRTLTRFVHLPIEPAAVAQVSATLPDAPGAIEDWVGETIVYDANDYAGWGAIL